MKGLYDQLVEQHRDKTQPPFRCRSCGGTEFREWWNQPDCSDIDEESIYFDGGSLSWDFHNYATSHSCDAGDTIDFWCLNCEDHADTLEELVGIPTPPKLSNHAVAFSWRGENLINFFAAESAEHAVEQTLNAYPDANIITGAIVPEA